jgi:hypothetical protein
MTDHAFMLSWDKSLVGDEEYTAFLVAFPGSGAVASWSLTRLIEVPDPVYFEANPRTLAQVNYPDNDANWPIMSERMRAIVLRDAPSHREIPVSMLDFFVEPKDRMMVDGKPRPEVATEGFAAVQLLARSDLMDMERSQFTPDLDFPGRARSVQHLVLRDGPLPSLFRLSAFPYPLFVSAEARRELDESRIAGVTYQGLDQIRFR